MKKRIVSLMLAVALCVGLLPGAAQAEGIPRTEPVILTADQCTIEGTTLTVHEGVGWFTLIGSDLELDGITTLVLPGDAYIRDASEIQDIPIGGGEEGCWDLTTIRVDAGNQDLSSADGVLFNKDGSKLICCPRARTGSYTVPDGVTEIGYAAFAHCDGVSGVTLPSTLTEIASCAFFCSGITSMDIPEGITVIENETFESCEKLVSVTIPEGVTEIVNFAFAWCGSLANVTLPSTLTTIGEGAFSDCYALTDIVIPEGVTVIERQAFWRCYELASIVIPEGVTEIGEETFEDCYALASATLPSTLTTIGESAFDCCYALTGVALPTGLTEIAGRAFFETGLREITIPDTVTKIGRNAFYSSNLTAVTIPAGVTEIGTGAFAECSSLTEIQVAEGNTAYCAQDGVLFTKDMTTLVTCPGGRTGTYAIPEEVTEVEDSAFCGCRDLTGVAIPEGVTAIGYSAFLWCHDLPGILIPASVTQIGEEAFVGCFDVKEDLTGVEVAQGNPAYCAQDGALFTKDMTTLLAFPVGRSGSYAIPEGVTTLGRSVFFQSNLSEITIPQGVTAIPEKEFAWSQLTSVTIPGSASVIGELAFLACKKLGRVTLVSGVTTLESGAFANCDSLTGISIPASVTAIDDFTFAFSGSDRVTIYGEAGSAAETYANRMGITFVVGEMPEATPITEEMFTVDLSAVTYTGEPQTKTVSGMDGDRVLVEDTDYVVKYENNVEVGIATMTITGIGSYYGGLTYYFVIEEAQEVVPQPPVRPSRPSTPSAPTTPAEPEPEEPTPASETYQDVEEGSWYEEAVTYVVEAGLFQGTGENTFAPTLPMTRGMIMTVLARYDGTDTDGGDKWYDKGMAWAMEKGISDGTRPEGNVTREELAVLLWRYAGSPEAQKSLESFPDGEQASNWATAALQWAVEQGILAGKNGGLLDPHGTATRAEVAIILMRYCRED